MKHKKLLIIALIVLILGIGAYFFMGESSSSSSYTPVTLTPESVPLYLVQTQIVKDLPDEASIQMEIGNNYYAIVGNSVTLGKIDNPDIEVWVPEEYLDTLGAKGICATIRIASAKNDLKIKTSMSNTALLWKYRSVGKYGDCFG